MLCEFQCEDEQGKVRPAMSGRFLSPNLAPGEGVGCLRPLSLVLTPLPPPQPWQGCSHRLLQPKWREAAGASAPAVLDSHPSGLTVSASHPPHPAASLSGPGWTQAFGRTSPILSPLYQEPPWLAFTPPGLRRRKKDAFSFPAERI